MITRNDPVLKEALRRDAVMTAMRAVPRIKCLGGQVQGSAAAAKPYYYKAVDEGYVAWRRVVAADAMIRFCMRRFKIPTVLLSWYMLCDPTDPGARLLGTRPTRAFVKFSPAPEIWLRADQKKFELMLAAAHECHHVWMEGQVARAKFTTLNVDERENAASAFAMIAFKEFQETFHFGQGD